MQGNGTRGHDTSDQEVKFRLSDEDTIRLKRDVEVHTLGNGQLYFQRGRHTLEVTSGENHTAVVESLRTMATDTTVGALRKLWSKRRQGDFHAFLSHMLTCELVELNPSAPSMPGNGDTAHFEPFSLNGTFSSAIIQKAARTLHLHLYGPKPLTDCCAALLGQYGVRTSLIEGVSSQNGETTLRIPDAVPGEYNLSVLYVGDLGPKAREHLSYLLARKNHDYIPISAEGAYGYLVGPLVTKDTPCLNCLELRRSSTRDYPAVRRTLASESSRLIRPRATFLTHLDVNAIAGIATMLTLWYLVGAPGEYMARKRPAYYINSAAGVCEVFQVHKVPWCTACAPSTHLPGGQEFRVKAAHAPESAAPAHATR